jgi:hypothetical protein
LCLTALREDVALPSSVIGPVALESEAESGFMMGKTPLKRKGADREDRRTPLMEKSVAPGRNSREGEQV